MDEGSMFCANCGCFGMSDGGDGFYYCVSCGLQSQDLLELATEDYDLYQSRYRRSQANTATQLTPQTLASLNPVAGNQAGNEDPFDHRFSDRFPTDFGTSQRPLDPDEFASGARLKYVEGMQVMIQLQCEALVQKFGANPLICGLVGPIWLRFVALSRVFDDDWANEAIVLAEQAKAKIADEKERPFHRISRKSRDEPRTLYGERAIDVWVRSLKSKIPLAASLAISFLACHISREAILPTDIVKWALEGKVPYIAAFINIEKYLGSPSNACPLSSRFLFRPVRVVTARQLESIAGSVAVHIDLHLPPVNFYSMARRFLGELELPTEKILPYACRIYEWSMPPDLWLSVNQYRLPTRVCMMSIIIVAIRLLYNINGLGQWEMSLTDRNPSLNEQGVNFNGKSEKTDCTCKFNKGVARAKEYHPFTNSFETGNHTAPVRNSLCIQCSDLDNAELFCNLETAYDKIGDTYDYSKDLHTYIKYCKEVVFAGLSMSYGEGDIVSHFWNLYEKHKEDINGPQELETACSGSIPDSSKHKKHVSISVDEKTVDTEHDARQNAGDQCTVSPKQDENLEENHRPGSPDYDSTASRNRALMRLILNMEENGFQYVPPRRRVQASGYLHYRRKQIHRKLRYVAHADYYILLRACAKVIKVDVRMLHLGLLKLERRLSWIESHINRSLPALHSISDFSSDQMRTEDV